MFMEERQKDIISRINETGRILVSEIQEYYQISADCARRDLRVLESRGLLQRTHGVAIAVNPKERYPTPTYNPTDIKEIQTDYLAVAQKAIEYIQNRDVIYITTSLVGYYMAENLPEDADITVLTNSVTIAEVLRKKMNFYTIQLVKNIRMDKAFLSHASLSLDFGASIHDPAGVEFGKAVMKNSRMNIGLYPSKKTGKTSIHSVCQVKDYDLLITDDHVSEDFLTQIRELGVSIEVVKLI